MSKVSIKNIKKIPKAKLPNDSKYLEFIANARQIASDFKVKEPSESLASIVKSLHVF